MKRHLAAAMLAVCSGFASLGALAADGYAAGRFGSYPLPELKRLATEQVRTLGESPADYVVGKFKDHDIVLLGESPHQVRQNLEFLQSLLPKLHAAGVTNLGYEMLRSEVQPQVDRLLNAARFDEQLANYLILDWDAHFGGYQEYRDVLRIAWQINSKLPKGAPRFRVVGLDHWYMPLDWSGVRAGEKGSDANVIKRNYGVRDRDMRWAQTIDDEILSKGGKALVFGGAGHTSTRFNWDRGFGTHHRTAGNLIHAYIGERSFRIALHGSEGIQESNLLEALVEGELAAGKSFGFDLRAGTPLGDLPSTKAGYLGRSRSGTPSRT
ncbi:ChaN family lipoprotein, partial [Steroidobacter sp.]|uniref:ChaN family lipoprotein n=1 Tax=Steroidobacter sp. TaxID=1978227 RepID=UPI001A46DD09